MHHGVSTGWAMKQALQQRIVAIDQAIAVATPMLFQLCLHFVEYALIDDRLVLAIVDLVLVPDLAGVNDVG